MFVELLEDRRLLSATEWDWGDAPDPTYPTLAASNGARHVIEPGFYLGGFVDADPDGQPDAHCLGDDLDGSFDEHGVSFLDRPEWPDTSGTITVTVADGTSAGGVLDAWIDFNKNGIWEDTAAEHFIDSLAVAPGTNAGIPMYIPEETTIGYVNARFRLTRDGLDSLGGDLQPYGEAPSGEVEDTALLIKGEGMDFGDAPADPYETYHYPTYSGQVGAVHLPTSDLPTSVYLGFLVDPEYDGQPNNTATGDDTDFDGDDEDGISPTGTFTAGLTTPVTVAVTNSSGGPAYLDAWFDLNRDGDWDDPDEQVVVSQSVSAGSGNLVNVAIPWTATPGFTFARFRLSSTGGLDVRGYSPSGEVEDYRFEILPGEVPDLDWGDAPDPTYATFSASNGPYHVLGSGLMMGTSVDPEPNGQPHPAALGDDQSGTPDDEDGIIGTSSSFVVGQPGWVDVLVTAPSGSALLDAWMDVNGNGTFDHPAEHLNGGTSISVTPGVNRINFALPPTAVPGWSFARLRISSVGNLPPTGSANDGEVEDYAVEIESPTEPGLDWGDAPDPTYATLSVSNGPSHVLGSGLLMGVTVDAEADGQPTVVAVGDDLVGMPNDEDGVVAASSFVVGQPGWVDVLVAAPSGSALLDGWMDLNSNGTFDHPAEHLNGGTSILVIPGVNRITFALPPTTVAGSTFARLRISSLGNLSPTGPANDGEVEDHAVEIELPAEPELDWGDAPDPTYATLSASSGPSHVLGSGLMMGTSVDAETDGQPDAMALGDDLVGTPTDEDGVYGVSSFVVGQPGWVDVLVAAPSGSALLDGWLDVNGNGTFDHPAEHLNGGTSILVIPGVNRITFALPPTALPGSSFARLRVSSLGNLPPTGPANDGEVEDHAVEIELPAEPELDWGDAPDPTYATLSASSGPSHVLGSGLMMGTNVDAEPDGQPDAMATGDDLSGTPDDEDGVTGISSFVTGQPGWIDVLVAAPRGSALLDGWLDLNGNGSFDHPAEHLNGGNSILVIPGVNRVTFAVPSTALSGSTFARLRISSLGNLPPTGPANDGEVEDHAVEILPPEDLGIDWGDAPDVPYPTLSASNGANHVIIPNFHLGATVDAEVDGQPNNVATGDDENPGPAPGDEDGVVLRTEHLLPGKTAVYTVTVTDPAGIGGFVDAWLDGNMDGTFDAAEHFLDSEPVQHGENQFLYPIPLDVEPGVRYARFRLSSTGGLSPTGPASDGEVEDYMVELRPLAADQVGVRRGVRFLLDANASGTWDGVLGGDVVSRFGERLTDKPIRGDWNGDGQDEVGVRRGRYFLLDVNGNGIWDTVAGGDAAYSYLKATDKPVIGDWNGDGIDDIGVRRGTKFLLDANGNGQWDGVVGGDAYYVFGLSTDIPVAGDWNGDGKDEVGVRRGRYFLLDANGNGVWDKVAGGDIAYAYLKATDKPVVGDWNGDGTDDIGVRRSTKFLLDANGNGQWDGVLGGDFLYVYGTATDTPVTGKWFSAPPAAPLSLLAAPSVVDEDVQGMGVSTGLAEGAFVQVVAEGETQLSAAATNVWQNPVDPLDSNRDGQISSIDALIIINTINSEGSHRLVAPASTTELPEFCIDPSGDGIVSPVDVLQVINFLNGSLDTLAEGEGSLPAMPQRLMETVLQVPSAVPCVREENVALARECCSVVTAPSTHPLVEQITGHVNATDQIVREQALRECLDSKVEDQLADLLDLLAQDIAGVAANPELYTRL